MNNTKIPHSTEQSFCHNNGKSGRLVTKNEYMQMTLEDSHASHLQPNGGSWQNHSTKIKLNSSKAGNSNPG